MVNQQQRIEAQSVREVPTSFVLKLVIVEGYIFEKDGQTILATPVENVSQGELIAEGLSNVNLTEEALRLA
jgi:hypothetical protein